MLFNDFITPATRRLERIAMGKTNIKNGTPVGSNSLCEACSNAQVMRGYRESERIVLWTYTFDRPIPVPFKVNQERRHHIPRQRPGHQLAGV